MIRFMIVFVAFLLLGLCGCLESKNPLCKQGEIDPALVGVWEMDFSRGFIGESGHWMPHWDDGRTKATITFAAKGKYSMTVTMTPLTELKDAEVFICRTPKSTYLMGIDPERGSKEKSGQSHLYELVKYEILDDKTLRIHGFDSSTLKQAVAHGELDGRISDTPEYNEMILTSDGEKILEWLEKHAQSTELTPESLTLQYRRR